MSTLARITATILRETSSAAELRAALDAFSEECSHISGLAADRSFSAWAEDSLLSNGVAINPHAAAHCVSDYRRSVVFIRAVYAALLTLRERFPDTPLQVLYAGCGPYATLLLPLLHKFQPGQLAITLLDVHQRSLDSAVELLHHFGEDHHSLRTVCADATAYQHPAPLHLVIAETMQKSLEQEPQFAVTARLAPQLCRQGVFLPQRIDVSLQLVPAADPATAAGQELAQVFSLRPEQPELAEFSIDLPDSSNLKGQAARLFTRIQVFQQHYLEPGDSELTLSRPCPELTPLRAGANCRIRYRLGSYPGFELEYTKETAQ